MSAEQDNSKAQLMVRYDRPFLLNKHGDGAKRKKFEMRRPQNYGAELQQESREIRDLLNVVLPPRCWVTEGGLTWKQTVSSIPATCQDVIHLQEQLEKRLHAAEARETGLCYIRRAIYAECLNEVIRQETINCSERGLLLVRIRDEFEVTLDAYEALYCSAIGFGIRKALQAKIEKGVLSEQVESMEMARDNIEVMLGDIQKKFEHEQSKAAELFAIEEQRFNDEMAFLKKAGAQLKAQLDAIMGPKKV